MTRLEEFEELTKRAQREPAPIPDVSLFISRTNARIRTRLKRMRRPARQRGAVEFT